MTSFGVMLILGLLISHKSVQSEELKLACDGALVDQDADGRWDSVTGGNGGGLEMCVGYRFVEANAVIVEFELPNHSAKLDSAIFSMAANGKYGTYPEDEPQIVPAGRVWVSWGSSADGTLDMSDIDAMDDGETSMKLGLFPAEGVPLSAGKRLSLDITHGIQEAIEGGGEYVSIIVVSESPLSETAAWRWRTSEFGEKYGRQNAPKLSIAFEAEPQ